MGLVFEHLGQLTPLPLIGAILYRASLSIGIGYTLQVWGQRHTAPTDAALILGLEAVFAGHRGLAGAPAGPAAAAGNGLRHHPGGRDVLPA